MTTWELFIDFLNKKGVYKEYMERYIPNYDLYDKNTPATWIVCAFPWVEEGDMKWHHLDNEWCTIIGKETLDLGKDRFSAKKIGKC